MSLMKWVRTLGVGLGLACLVYLLRQCNIAELIQVAVRIRWGLLVILALTLPKYFIYAISWQKIMRHLKQDIPLKTLFRIKLIGESVNYATPLNVIGGDSSRVMLLAPLLPVKEAGLAVLLVRASHMLSGFVIMLAGAIGLLSVNPLVRDKFTYPSNYLPLLLALLMITTCSIGIALFRKKITLSWQQHGKIVSLGIVLTALGRLFSVLEIYLIGIFIHVPLSFVQALILNGLSLGLTTLFAFVPSGIGILEGGFAGYLAFLGWPPAAGLAIQLVRRVNGLFWILCGAAASVFKTSCSGTRIRT